VPTDGDIELDVRRQQPELTLHVHENEPQSVRRGPQDRRLLQTSDDAEAGLESWFVPFVVAVTTDERTTQLAQRGDGKGRDQVPGEQHRFAAGGVEELHRPP
jgi:hypothetical protein